MSFRFPILESMAKKQRQKAAQCWWCNQPGASKEDVIPRWLRRLYPEEGWWVHEYDHPALGDSRVKRAKGPAQITRKFCRKCNNEWMSRVETRAKPILSSLIRGERARLDPQTQELLGFWVCKTIFAFQSVEPDPYNFIRPDLYRELFEKQGPVAGCQIWLGQREAPMESIAWFRAHSLENREGDCHGFGATLSVGNLLAHLVCFERADHALQARGRIAGALGQIWPVKRQCRLWPPPTPIEPGDLSWFGRSLVETSDLLAA